MGGPPVLRRLSVRAAAVALFGSAFLAFPQPAIAVGPPDHVLFWNSVLLRTFRQIPGAPGPHARAGAMVHGAIYDAANSALCAASQTRCLGQRYLIQVAGTAGVIPDVATAIDYAAYDTLNSLRTVYPSLNFDADLATAQQGIPDSPERAEGRRMGSAAAQAMINARTGDGFPDTSGYTASTAPGFWRPTGSGPAATPSWGLLRPFAMTSGSQFRPGPPLGISSVSALLASSGYAAQFNEVKELGAANSSTRTAEQTRTAFFWANDLDGTYKPPGQHFAHAQAASAAANLTQDGNARLFALLAIAMADASIVAWDAKYLTPIDLWRPETAIREADTDGNNATKREQDWQPLSADNQGVRFSPPFPAYSSGHATFAGAWAAAMRGFFGVDSFSFVGGTDDPHAQETSRSFGSFSGTALQDARSRVYLGVHYQFDADAGVSSGSALGNHVSTNFLRPAVVYTFTGFWLDGQFVGLRTERDEGTPVSATFGFQLTDAAGNPVTDPAAIVGARWDFDAGASMSAPTFNPTTGRFEISGSIASCTGIYQLQVWLRDGSIRSFEVFCPL